MRFGPGNFSRLEISISLTKNVRFQKNLGDVSSLTNAQQFRYLCLRLCLTISTDLLSDSILEIRYPSMAASEAQIGSISVTITLAPWPRSSPVAPLPTSPYLATRQTVPPIKVFVARSNPSVIEWLHCIYYQTLSGSHSH